MRFAYATYEGGRCYGAKTAVPDHFVKLGLPPHHRGEVQDFRLTWSCLGRDRRSDKRSVPDKLRDMANVVRALSL